MADTVDIARAIARLGATDRLVREEALAAVDASLDQKLAEGRQTAILQAEQDVRVDAVTFATGLSRVGFVRTVDGTPCACPPWRRPSLAWMTTGRVRWLASKWLPWVWAALAVGLLGWGLVHGVIRIWPGDYFAFSSPTANIVLNAALPGLLLVMHEVAHIAMARAYGQPGRIRLSTRLCFVVAESDVSAVRLVGRSGRIRTYLAGMAWDVLVLGILGLLANAHIGAVSAVCRAGILFLSSSLLLQLCCFMRTDTYFVLQDVLDRPNLFPDAIAYLKAWLRRGSLPKADRAIRLYAAFVLLGSTATLAWFAVVGLPITVELLLNGVRHLVGGAVHGNALEFLDGIVTLGFEGSLSAFMAWRLARRALSTWLRFGRRPNH